MANEPDVVKLGLRIIDECERSGVVARLLGGVAVYVLVSDIYGNFPELSRVPKDIDLVAHAKDSHRLSRILEDMGLEGDRRFNALHGHERLLFRDKSTGTRIDVFLDIFRESHVINLKDRLEQFKPTIPPSDLLLTKLQIWRLTERDAKDILAMFIKFNLSDKDTESNIDMGRITSLTSDDWGLYKTVTINIGRVRDYAASSGLRHILDRVEEKLRQLSEAIEKSPKTMKWRLRAIIGERVRWYEEPEEVQ